MRIPRASIHPSVWAARDRFFARAMNGGEMKAEEVHALTASQTQWFRSNGPAFIVGLLVFFALMIGLVSLKHSMSKGALVTALLFLMGSGAALILSTMRGSRSYIDTAEFRRLLPVLLLTPIQKAYGEALIALPELKLDAASHDELVAQLNALLDEEERLLALRSRSLQPGTSSADVLLERDSLRSRLAETADPVAREALERSLEICEGRLASSQDTTVVAERIDAQLEVIAQSMRNFRDTLIRLHAAPLRSNADLNLDPIRDTVRQAQQHAQALESAVREMEKV